MNNKDNKEEKDLEELKKALKNDDDKKIGLLLGFYLHENFSIHILLTIIINLISGGVIIGLSSVTYKIVEVNSYIAFFLAFLFYSLLEISIKTLLIRFIWKIILQSLGLIFFVVNIVFFYITSLLVDNFSFYNNLSNIFIFTIIFMVFRMLLTTVIKRINIPLGGNKK
ncbi:MAG: phage holin family protein [Acholeplasmataceae bacterium]